MTQKRYNVYRQVLGTLYIIDTEKKEHGTAQLNMYSGLNDMHNVKKITKATINKHRKDYEKNRWNPYVITSPILATLSDDMEEKELHTKRASRDYIGTFESMNELKAYFENLYNVTKEVREKYHFVNFGSRLLEVSKAIKDNETYNNWYEKDWALYELLKSV